MVNAMLYDLAMDTEPHSIHGAVQRGLILLHYTLSWLKPYAEVAARVNWLATTGPGTGRQTSQYTILQV